MQTRRSTSGFTIVELLVAASITVVIVVLLGTMFGSLMTTASRSNQRIDSFRDARAAIQMIQRDLSAVVRTQWQINNGPPPAPPVPITRPTAFFAISDIYPDPGGSSATTGTNQQLYALIAVKNDGAGDVCSVGYYCRWDPAKSSYNLHRFFANSQVTYDRLVAAAANYTSAADLYKPAATDDVVAPCVWDFKVTAYDASGATISTTPPYVCDASSAGPTATPATVEISFRAMSSEAARTVMASQSPATVWLEQNDVTYKRLIAPHAYEFRTRIRL